MNILVLAPQPFYKERGTPIAVKMLVEDLSSAGNHITLLTFSGGEDVSIPGVEIIKTTSFSWFGEVGPGFSLKKLVYDFFMVCSSIRLCHKREFEIVHAVEEAVFIACILKLIFRVRYIYDVDSWMSDQLIDKYPLLKRVRFLFSFFERKAVKGSDATVVVCKALEEKIKGIAPAIPTLLLEDVSLLNNDNGEVESLRELVGERGSLILYVGNLEKYQGIDLLIDAFSIHHQKHPENSLVIIGGERKGREKYQEKAKELAIGQRVFLIGTRPLDNLGMYLKQADLLVSPRTDGENTPMKIYSYLESGIPVVATNIKSHTQVLDEKIAVLTDADAVAMADAFEKILENGEIAQELSQAARQRVENRYSRNAFSRKITGFYSELANVWNMRI